MQLGGCPLSFILYFIGKFVYKWVADKIGGCVWDKDKEGAREIKQERKIDLELKYIFF